MGDYSQVSRVDPATSISWRANSIQDQNPVEESEEARQARTPSDVPRKSMFQRLLSQSVIPNLTRSGRWLRGKSAILVEEAPKPHAYIIDPRSKLYQWWTTIIIVLSLYNASVIPWQFAFITEDFEEVCDVAAAQKPTVCYSSFWASVDVIVTIAFCAHILVCARTGRFDDRMRQLETEPKPIFFRYLKTWLVPDVISVIPFAIMIQPMKSSVVIKSVRMLQLLRLSHILRHRDKLGMTPMSRAVELLIAYLMVAHWVACGFFFLSRWQVEELEDYGRSTLGLLPWILNDYRTDKHKTDKAADEEQVAFCRTILSSKLWFDGIQWTLLCSDMVTKYTSSIFWSITTMATVGYGNIVPKTNMERQYTMAVELVGAVTTALIFGNMAILLQSFDMFRTRLQAKLDALDGLFRSYNVPSDMAEKIKNNVIYLWNLHRGMDVNSVLQELPTNLRTEVLMELEANVVQQAPLFKYCDEAFVRAIVLRLKPQVFLPDEVIVEEGEAGNEMYFISQGSVKVTNKDGTKVYATLSHGDCFGELEAFVVRRRRATVIATTYCHLYSINRDCFDEVIMEFPELQELIKKASNEHVEFLRSQSPSYAEIPASPDIRAFSRSSRSQSPTEAPHERPKLPDFLPLPSTPQGETSSATSPHGDPGPRGESEASRRESTAKITSDQTHEGLHKRNPSASMRRRSGGRKPSLPSTSDDDRPLSPSVLHVPSVLLNPHMSPHQSMLHAQRRRSSTVQHLHILDGSMQAAIQSIENIQQRYLELSSKLDKLLA